MASRPVWTFHLLERFSKNDSNGNQNDDSFFQSAHTFLSGCAGVCTCAYLISCWLLYLPGTLRQCIFEGRKLYGWGAGRPRWHGVIDIG